MLIAMQAVIPRPPDRDTLVRAARCLTVSVGTTVMSAAVLVALALGLGVAPGTANVVAVVCGIVPSYLANRRWVWGRRDNGPRRWTSEVAPFWALSIAGLIGSTIAVDRVAAYSHGWSSSVRAVALPVANLAVFGVLWVVQFVVLDRVIFRSPALDQECEP